MLYTDLKVFKLCWYFKCIEYFPWRFLINILTDSFSVGALTILAEVSFHLLKKEVNPSFSFCFNISSCLWSVSSWMLHLYLSMKVFVIDSQEEVFSFSREKNHCWQTISRDSENREGNTFLSIPLILIIVSKALK